MSKSERIIGLVGPSGVGKGFCKEALKDSFDGVFVEPVIITTRPQRSNDGPDRKAGIPLQEFEELVQAGTVVFAHQPFGVGTNWYGFSAQGITNQDKLILTEVHVDNIVPFKEKFGDGVRLIALTAERDYLEVNLAERGSENEEEAKIRLNRATDELEKIKELLESGYLDTVIQVGNHNRSNLGSLITEIVSDLI